MKRTVPIFKKILVLGSGALKIGEAGEFDYSGSQALKALREEGISTILVNPNIATIQTSKGMADRIYLLPVDPSFVAKVIAQERPDGILLGFGGQTALNCGIALHNQGILRRHNVSVCGTSISTIKITENRKLFAAELRRLHLETPQSEAVTTLAAALRAARRIGFPAILRAAYSLGGKGSTVVYNEKELRESMTRALNTSPQVLIEEYLEGWKEIEYEVMRDALDNCITICNMENIDPLGIHTGESIVVAPSQTLTNHEYHTLRAIAIALIRSLRVVGECNVQFALDPHSGDYRIIEVNARLSRSSALASKATGYPIAYIAAKLAVGHTLTELKNSVTKTTTACFEPALDYIALKMPRWDLKKFKNVSSRIGPEMKSVGEVMAIGRTFEETLQKAIRMLDIGARGLIGNTRFAFKKLANELKTPTDERIFAITEAFKRGWSVAKVASLTHINPWFLQKMKNIVVLGKILAQKQQLSAPLLRTLKMRGFSDIQIARLKKTTEKNIRSLRKSHAIVAHAAQIDTLAGEYPAQTNYLYMTYGAHALTAHGTKRNKWRKKIIVLGSGVYKIGSSVEFDWCAVNTVRTLHKLGYETVMINCNPETVSTDYDECDRLYFEELTLERILDIYEQEKPAGIIISVGGQVSNTLAPELQKIGVKIFGTSAQSIIQAEDRHTFSNLLRKLNIAQPAWQELTSVKAVKHFAQYIGYPVLVRPSFVLSGTAMAVAFNADDLHQILIRAQAEVNSRNSIVVSKFIIEAREFEIDAVAQKGKLIVWALTEHVENAGVHSGDSTMILPAQKIYQETQERALEIVKKISSALSITGPFNIQFLAKNDQIMVIECNLRASRSFPFVSKVLGINFIELATRAMLDKKLNPVKYEKPSRIGVKAPQFSFSRLHDADPVLTVEMSSTGEVASFGVTKEEAFSKALLATGFILPKKNILLSLGGDKNKTTFLESAKKLLVSGFILYATPRTAAFLDSHRVRVTVLYKPAQQRNPSVEEALRQKTIELFINTSDEEFPEHIPDDYRMRRIAADFGIPLITNIQLAKLLVTSLLKYKSVNISNLVSAYDTLVLKGK